jgi:hypothetical protein
MVFALTADAYRGEGRVHEAAAWYRHASTISPGGHAIIYAHLVCKHGLTEFYDDAFRTLVEHRRRWFARPVIERFFLRLVAWRMWMDKEGREIARTEASDYEFLVKNTSKVT